MDSDSFQADLNALRKLYTLLQINESGNYNALSGILDEDTRNFLKKLLDDAAKKIYEDHMKTEAINWRSVLGTNSLGQLEEVEKQEKLHYAISKLESLVPKLHHLAKHVPTPTKTKSEAAASSSCKKIWTSRKTSRFEENNDRRQVAQLNESDSSRSDSSSWKAGKVSSSSSSSSGTAQTSTTGSRGENDSQSSSSRTTYVTSKSSRSSPSSYVSSGDDDLNPSDNYESSSESVAHRKEGMFRRLKNKLGVIFHHHHHHHHHHHPHPHDKSDDASVSQSVWKKEVGKKKLKRTEKRVEAKVGKKFRKTEKKAETENQKQVRKGKKHPGHFRALLGGLMRHAIESRKRKLGRGPRRKKPNLRLKGVKLAHKPRMKLQLGEKKGSAKSHTLLDLVTISYTNCIVIRLVLGYCHTLLV